MKSGKQLIALNLVLVLLLSLFPFTAFAVEEQSAEQAAPVEAVETADEGDVVLVPGESIVQRPEDDMTCVLPEFTATAQETGLYRLRIASPEGTGYTVHTSSSTGANMTLYTTASDLLQESQYSLLVWMESGAAYAFQLSTEDWYVSYYGALDITGDWTVSLEKVEPTELTLGEPAPVSADISADRVYHAKAEQAGSFVLTIQGFSSVQILLVQDGVIRERTGSYSESRLLTVEENTDIYLIPWMYLYEDPGYLTLRMQANSGEFGEQGNNLSWSYDEETRLLHISGEGAMGNLCNAVPWTDYREQIDSVLIDPGVTDIGDNAFEYCSSLRQVQIPDTVTRIGSYAFYDCYLLDVADLLTPHVAEIGSYAFAYVNAPSTLTLPEGLVKIDDGAFARGYFNVLEIPASVTEIGDGAFTSSNRLAEIRVSGDSQSFKAEDGVLFSKDGKRLVCFPSIKQGPYTIPDTVEEVQHYAFSNCRMLKTLLIPAAVRSLGGQVDFFVEWVRYAGTEEQWNTLFGDTEETYDWKYRPVVEFQADLSDKCGAATTGRTELGGRLELPFTPQSDGLYRASLVNRRDGNTASYYASGSSMVLFMERGGEGLHNFDGEEPICVLSGGESYQAVMDNCDSGEWELAVQKVPAEMLALGENRLSAGSNGSYGVFAPEEDGWFTIRSVENISHFTAANSADDTIVGGNPTTLQVSAGKPVLVRVFAAERGTPCVLQIEKAAQEGACGENLTWRIEDGTLVISGTGAMYDYGEDEWSEQAPAPWRPFMSEIRAVRIEDGATSLGSFAFCGMREIRQITIADSVKHIGAFALSSCSGLTTLRLPASLESLDLSALRWTSLDELTLPAENTKFVIKDGVLYDKEFTTLHYAARGMVQGALEIPDTVNQLSPTAFCDCTELTDVVIPAAVESVDMAFRYCSSLKTVHFAGKNTRAAADGAFTGCYALSDVYYPGSVLDWAALNNSVPDWATVHFAEQPQAEDVTLGEHTASAPWQTLKFTAPEDGVYRFDLGYQNWWMSLRDEEGKNPSAFSRPYYDESGVKYLPLKSGEIVYVTFSESADMPETLAWSISKADLSDAVPGSHTDSVNGAPLFFRFTAQKDGVHRLTATSYSTVWVYDTEKDEMRFNDGYNASLQFEAVAGRTYYLAVKDNNGSEELSWRLDEPVSAVELALGENTVHYAGMDVPCLFTPEEDGWYVVMSHADGRDPYVELYNADGDRLKTDDDSFSNMQFLLSYQLEAGETYTYQVFFVDGSGEGDLPITLVKIPFNYDAQPQDQVAAPGETVTFRVQCSGENLTYQWYEVDSKNHREKMIEDATGDTLTFAAQPEQNGNAYFCKATYHNDEGGYYVWFNSCYAYLTVTEAEHQHDIELRGAAAATCTEDGYTGDEVCKTCGAIVKKGEVIPALGHDYKDVVTAPTCTEKGYTTHTCSRCGDSFKDSYVDALGHDTERKNASAATCTRDGYTGDEVCKTCGEIVKKGSVIKATGHKWDAGKVTKEPTETAEGVKTFTCTVCGATRTEAIPKLTPTKPANPFKDVKDGAYYYDPVLWALNHDPQITDGTSETTFSPDATCTRGQVVTFLWRANGCPEPKSTSNPFKDVKSGDYFYKAVLWAVEKGITDGTSETTFSPNAGCTRGQVVTFLWRADGKPAASGANPFTDVKTSDYFYQPVLWAGKAGITDGTSDTTFSPDKTCTRGQIVTFLYRDKT